ncbi:MAG: Ig-like domain-containing protein, partial [Methylophilaceae bacterium]|nr:Ig-like domain-containing protein [Methylophilaceae bacterium]
TLIALAPPITPTLTLASDTGFSASDNNTSNATINVGNLDNSARWSYQVDGASWLASGTSPNFTATSGTHTYRVRQVDVADNTSLSQPVIYLLDTFANTPSLQLAFDSGVSSDQLTNNPTVLVMGLESGAQWAYQVDGNASWVQGAVNSSYFIATSGVHVYAVRQTDLAGNVSPASTGFTYTLVTIDNLTPVLSLASDTGASPRDGISSNPTIVVLNLHNETGASWSYQVDAGTWAMGTGSTFTATTGAHTYSVRQTDIVGNTSPTNSTQYTFDNVPPPLLTLSLFSDTGSDASDGITANPTINVLGLEAQAIWQYQVDSTTGSWINIRQRGNSNSFIAEIGTHTYFAQQIDVAGNTSAVSAGVVVTLDNTAPTVTSSTFSALENTTDVGALTASKAVTWALGTGADTALFNLVNSALSFKAAPNYEAPRGNPFNASTNTNAYTVNVMATDVAGNVKAQAIVVNISDVNEMPVVISPTPASAVLVNHAVSLNVANAFSDPDTQATDATWRTLTYTATGLPSGLSISATGVISGTATTTTASAVTVTVTATDGGGLNTTETFNLSVVDAPVISNFTVRDNTAPNHQVGKSGDTLTFVVTMSEAVTVVTT